MQRGKLNRGKPPKRRTGMPAASTPIRQSSAKREAVRPTRDIVIDQVVSRDRDCVARHIDSVPCGPIPGRKPLECHELKRGSMRALVFLDPDWCVAICPQSHVWITNHPLEAQRRGLAVPSTASVDMRTEAADLRAAWSAGETPDPSWFHPPRMTL